MSTTTSTTKVPLVFAGLNWRNPASKVPAPLHGSSKDDCVRAWLTPRKLNHNKVPFEALAAGGSKAGLPAAPTTTSTVGRGCCPAVVLFGVSSAHALRSARAWLAGKREKVRWAGPLVFVHDRGSPRALDWTTRLSKQIKPATSAGASSMSTGFGAVYAPRKSI